MVKYYYYISWLLLLQTSLLIYRAVVCSSFVFISASQRGAFGPGIVVRGGGDQSENGARFSANLTGFATNREPLVHKERSVKRYALR